jgi:hypothetical protein
LIHPAVPRRVLRAEGYAALESALTLEVRRAREADPLRPIDLLVGSNLLGIHLRRLLARRLGALADVRTSTFLDLARARAERALAGEGQRPLPPLGDDLIIGGIVSSLPSGGTFDPVRETPGFRAVGVAHSEYPISALATAPDGRLFITFRDTTLESPTKGDWVGWVGKYEDIVDGREGQYRVRLMDNTKGADCTYPGTAVLGRLEGRRHGACLLAAGIRRQDACIVGVQGKDRCARLVPQGLHRRLNGRMQVAP